MMATSYPTKLHLFFRNTFGGCKCKINSPKSMQLPTIEVYLNRLSPNTTNIIFKLRQNDKNLLNFRIPKQNGLV